MTRFSARFWTLALVLLSSLAPAWANIGVGLHLASDHHQLAASEAGGTLGPVETLAIELAQAASHGHRHDFGTPAHDHTALRVVAAPTIGPGGVDFAPVASWAQALPEPATRAHREPPGGSRPQTGPPELFYRHCALLL